MDRDEAYRALATTIESVLAGVRDRYAAMATFAALLHHGFGHLWTGFYVVAEPRLLRVGPYQGTLGCLEIAFGRGVCGTAAEQKKTVVVDDVHAFPGHISCDGRARSEIVVPVLDRGGALIAVLDIDSEQHARFDARDVAGLELLVRWFARADLLPIRAAASPVAAVQPLPRLLVVDDESGILNALRRMLRAHYEVTTMADGREALAALLADPPFDLVLTDLMMPVMTGQQLYEQATAARPQLAERFVFLSGGAHGPELHDFLARFPGRCVDKPFELAPLIARLRAIYAVVGASTSSNDVTA